MREVVWATVALAFMASSPYVWDAISVWIKRKRKERNDSKRASRVV